jgi:hypothetical protein
MHVLLAPVFAQLLTLGLTDRVDGNYITSSYRAKGVTENNYFEAKNTTTPNATLVFDWRHASITFGYAPSLTIVPLEGPDPEFLVYQQGFFGAQYAWRHTTLNLTQTAGYGQRDFYKETLMPNQAPPAATPPQQTPGGETNTGNTGTNTPPANTGTAGTGTTGGSPTTGTGGTTTGGTTGGTPGTGGTAIPAHPHPTRYGAFRTLVTLDQAVTRDVSWHAGVGYSITGGMTTDARKTYPLTYGPDANASVRYAVDARNTLTTIASAQMVTNDAGTNALLLIGGEDYSHQFSRQTMFLAGAGISFGRSEPPLKYPGGAPIEYVNGLRLPVYGVYPTARVSLTHTERAGNSTVTLATGAATTPVVDITSATLDPRVGAFATASWALQRFSLTANGLTVISVAKTQTNKNTTSFGSVTASLTAHYDLKSGFLLDGGVRSIWQQYGGNTLVAPTLVIFFAVSWVGLLPVNEAHHQ